jgi:hypothetical protein
MVVGLKLEALMLARALPLIPLAAAAIAVAGCRSADRSPSSDAPQSEAAVPGSASGYEGPTVLAVAARDFAFEARAEVPAGMTTIRLLNNGPSLHHVQLFKLEDGKTVDDFMTALKAPGPLPAWVRPVGGPNPPEPAGTASITETLEPGKYIMVCFVPSADGMPHVMKGMMRPLTVTPASGTAGSEPKADITMKLVDFDFQPSQPLTPGRHTIRVENAGSQPHEVAFVRMNPGKTPQDFANWGMKPVGPAPGSTMGGVSAIMPGAHVFVHVDLPPGDYALLCFVPDGKDGKPHFAHGMAKLIKVG